MRGTSFQRPLEFNLQVEGETWTQGDAVTGMLTVKNHGNEAVPLADVRVQLGDAGLKKVHSKAADAFDILATAEFEATAKIDPQGQATLPWTFQLERNSPITDKSSSPFLLYGRGKAEELAGQLQLNVGPNSLIREFLDTFKIQCRFVEKQLRSAKAGVEAKMVPPDSPFFSRLEYAVVGFRFKGDDLEVSYRFSVKQLEATAAAVDIKKTKKALTQVYTPTQYRTSTGRVSHERFEAGIKEALGLTEGKPNF